MIYGCKSEIRDERILLFFFFFWGLQQLWNDVGENEVDKDQMILELEMQCLQLYQKKVEEAANIKARLQQSIAAKEAELATLMASLAEPNDRSLVR